MRTGLLSGAPGVMAPTSFAGVSCEIIAELNLGISSAWRWERVSVGERL